MDVDLREMFDKDFDGIKMYDNLEDDCDDCDDDEGLADHQMFGYDYEYEEVETESIYNMYENCLIPSVYDTAKYLLPLFLTSLLFNLITHIVITKKLSHNIYHIASIVVGIFIIQHYVPESFYIFGIYVLLSYAFLYLSKKYKKGVEMFIFSLVIILYCEYSMNPIDWHKIRGVMMIAVMKTVSVSIDKLDTNYLPNIWEFCGYIFGSTTCIFGPWIPFKDYTASLNYKEFKTNAELLKIIIKNIFHASKNIISALIFLGFSNCLISWLLPDYYSRWVLAYRDALSFRTSHYFISYVSSSVLLLGGFTSSLTKVTKPLDIELPRSLVQVVVSWNIPMHAWLKIYIFRVTLRKFGKFVAITLTYLASSLLHGLNFQLSAVLLSLGFYTYVEYQLRNILAETFDACVAAKKCQIDKCDHKYNDKNSIYVTLINIVFTILSVFHLAYLGIMFDTSKSQETGYNYSHTIEKWSQLGFASHWIIIATYLIYFLLK